MNSASAVKRQILIIGLILLGAAGCAWNEKTASDHVVPVTSVSEDYGTANSQCRLESWKSPKSGVITSRKVYNQCMEKKGFKEIQ